MKKLVFISLVIFLLSCSIVYAGIFEFITGDGTRNPPSIAGSCGDGVCNIKEKILDSCSEDCSTTESTTSTTKTTTKRGCGDGKCSFREKIGKCDKDCSPEKYRAEQLTKYLDTCGIIEDPNCLVRMPPPERCYDPNTCISEDHIVFCEFDAECPGDGRMVCQGNTCALNMNNKQNLLTIQRESILIQEPTQVTPPSKPECDDGYDNDGDGKIDYNNGNGGWCDIDQDGKISSKARANHIESGTYVSTEYYNEQTIKKEGWKSCLDYFGGSIGEATWYDYDSDCKSMDTQDEEIIRCTGVNGWVDFDCPLDKPICVNGKCEDCYDPDYGSPEESSTIVQVTA